MEERVNVETLPAVAEVVRKWMPELQGRVIAVTDGDVTKDNVPTLPLAMVAPIIQNFVQSGQRLSVTEDFMLEVWLKPERIKGERGETPFWTYYAYNEFRNKLFTLFATWRTPQNGTLSFVSMNVESNYLATVISVRLRATYDVCPDMDELECPAEITFTLCPPASPACPPEPEQEKGPCPE